MLPRERYGVSFDFAALSEQLGQNIILGIRPNPYFLKKSVGCCVLPPQVDLCFCLCFPSELTLGAQVLKTVWLPFVVGSAFDALLPSIEEMFIRGGGGQD